MFNLLVLSQDTPSILGPLFLLIYNNDLSKVSELVDDTNLFVFVSHRNPNILVNTLNSELENLSVWLKANKLSLNLNKTKFMFFKSRKKLQELNLQVYINDQQIEQVNETLFLGVVLDENLTWKAHISHIANKISKSIILE